MTWRAEKHTCNMSGLSGCEYVHTYAAPPLMYPRFVLELCGMVVVSLQTFPISTILRHMQRTLKY